MREQTAFDILAENLKKRGIEPFIYRIENSFILPESDRFNNLKYIIAPIGDTFFVASDSFSTKQYTSSTYSGIYSTYSPNNLSDCKIYKKDRADMFFRVNKKKTGIGYIDSNLTVTSKSNNNPSVFLKQIDVKEYLSLYSIISPLKIVFEKNYISTVDALVDKSVIGVETNYWVYEDKELDILLDKGIKLVNRLKNACV